MLAIGFARRISFDESDFFVEFFRIGSIDIHANDEGRRSGERFANGAADSFRSATHQDDATTIIITYGTGWTHDLHSMENDTGIFLFWQKGR
jgi:hypothetical protein